MGVVNLRELLRLGLVALGVLVLAACASSSAPGQPASATPKPPSPLSQEPTITPPTSPPPHRLVVKDLITGDGDVARPGDQVTVNYVGVLYRDGKALDSSWGRRHTFTTDLSNGSIMSGWVTGIVGERVGGRRELIIPPNLAYGPSGNPPKIPPNATLIYDIDLLSVSAKSGDH